MRPKATIEVESYVFTTISDVLDKEIETMDKLVIPTDDPGLVQKVVNERFGWMAHRIEVVFLH